MSENLKILLLEDVKSDVDMVNYCLNKSNYTYSLNHVKTKDEYLQSINEFNPDLILSDYVLPGFSGLEALELAVQLCPETPFIFITGAIDEKTAIDFIYQGAWDYVLKENLLRLIPAIENAIKLKKEKDNLRAVQKVLEVSNAKYLDLYENAMDMYLSIDMRTSFITQCNNTLAIKTGYTKSEIIGRSVFDFYPKNTFDSIREVLIPVIFKKGKIENAEINVIKKDQSVLVGLTNAIAEYGEDGLINSARIIIRDITKRHEAEIILRKQKENFEALYEEYQAQNENLYENVKRLALSRKNLKSKIDIINRSPIVTFSWENKFGWPVHYVSENAENIFGYSADDFMSGKINYFDVIHPDDIERVKKEVDTGTKIKNKNKFSHKTYRIKTKNNETRWVNDDTVIISKKGKVTNFEGIISDVTGRIKIQQALKLSENRYRKMLDANPDMIIISDNNYKITYMNPSANDYFGSKGNKESCYSSLFGFDTKCEWCKHNICDFKENYQEEIKNPKNKKRYIISFSKIKNSDGSISYMSTYKDVTEIRKVQNERLKLLKTLEAGLNEIYLFDAGTLKFQYVNNRVIQNLGYTSDEIMKLTLLDLIPEINDVLFSDLINPLIQGKEDIVRFENVYKRKDGTTYPVDVELQLIDQEGDKVFLAVTDDITDKLQKEETIRKLSTAIEQSSVSVIITDITGDIEFANSVVYEITGYSREELIGQNLRVLKSGVQDELFYKNLWETITSGNVWRGEFHNKKKNGELYWEETTISPVRDTKGKITHYIALKEDITNRKKIENKLIESEQHFRKIFERSLIGMYLTTPEGEVIRANKTLYKMLGYNSLDELKKINLETENGYVTNRNEFKEKIKINDYVVGLESVWTNKNGESIYVRESAGKYIDEKGQIFYEGTVENITDWKLADKALKEMHNFNERIIKVGKLGYATYNVKGKCLTVNESFAEIVGGTQEQILEQNFKKIHNWKNTGLLKSAEKCIKEGMHSKTIIEDESTFKKHIWIEIHFSRIYKDEEVQLLVILKDISSIIRAKKRQLQTKAEFINLIENVNVPVFGINKDGFINEWNVTIERLSGYKRKEVRGKNFEKLFIEKNDNSSYNFVKDSITGVEISNIKFNMITKSNNVLKLLLSTTIRRNIYDEIDGIICVGQDITEIDDYKIELEKKVEERTYKLIEALKKEKELRDLKSQFVSMASHEFRTPLAAISFAAGFIKKYGDRIDKEAFNKRLDKIDDQIGLMTALLDDVLTIGKADAKLKFNPKKLDYNDFIKSIIEEVKMVTKNSHEIRINETDDYIMIDLDPKLGRNIFINLLTNAIKFSPEKDHILFENKIESGFLITKVTDFGIGIPEEELEMVFTPFHRARNTEAIQGTGLGLPIVKEAVEAHKGTISVESEKNKGTIFTVIIPVIQK